LERQPPDRADKFDAAWDYEGQPMEIQKLLEIASNLDAYEYYPDVSSALEYCRDVLGDKSVTPDEAAKELQTNGGTITEYGYIFKHVKLSTLFCEPERAQEMG
jgi:hypothetical protein